MCVCVCLRAQSERPDKAFCFPRELIFYIYLYICMYNIYMHTHNTRTPCPVLGGSLFLSCLVLLSSAQWSHALHFSRGGGCSTSLSSPRKRHIHHNESPYSHAARHTINKRNSSCVCSTEKKKEPTINMTKTKRCLTRNKQVASSSLYTTRQKTHTLQQA